MRSSLRSISSKRRRIEERLLSKVIIHRNARKRPQPPLLARAAPFGRGPTRVREVAGGVVFSHIC
jgi:hypothetical protein